MTASNSQGFKFDYDSQSGKYGYVVSEGGADTFVPFSSGKTIASMTVDLGSYSGNVRIFPITVTYTDQTTWSFVAGRDSTGANIGTIIVFDGVCTIGENRSGASLTVTPVKDAVVNNTPVSAGNTYTGARAQNLSIVF